MTEEELTLDELIHGAFEAYELSISNEGVKQYLHRLRFSHEKVIFDAIINHMKEEELIPPLVETIRNRIENLGVNFPAMINESKQLH